MKSVKGKRIVITGAASGLGRLLTLACAGEKAEIALVDRNSDGLARVEEELEPFATKAKSYCCDLAIREEIKRTAAGILKDFGGVDILVNNAGIANGDSLADLSFDDIKKTIDVNLMGPIWFTKTVLPSMIQNGRGQIVNIASAAGLMGIPRLSDYCASKFGLVGFSDALRLELKGGGYKNIKVTCVCPSYIDTGMFKGAKAPILSPFLKQDVAAGKIFRAIKKEKAFLLMPWSTHTIKWARLFPTSWMDQLSNVLGLNTSMNKFVSRDKR